MVVAPTTCGKAFKFKVGEVVVDNSHIVLVYVTGVVEYGHIRVGFFTSFCGSSVIFFKNILKIHVPSEGYYQTSVPNRLNLKTKA